MNFPFLGAIINAITILENVPRSQQMKSWSKFGGKKEREDSYYPYAKPKETSVGNGDKPLLPDYSNVSAKHFTYGNTCLNLAGFTKDAPSLKTEHWHPRKNRSPPRVKVSSLLLVYSFTSGSCRLQLHCYEWRRMEKLGIATCSWSFKEQFRQDSIPICCKNHQEMMTWRTECWQKPWTSSPSVC